MGCVKMNGTIKVNKIESNKKNDINDLEQQKLISTYVSSSQCGDSEASSKINSIKNKSDKDAISENIEKSESSSSDSEKNSQKGKNKN